MRDIYSAWTESAINQELINTLSSEDNQETECAQERQPDEVVDQQLPAA